MYIYFLLLVLMGFLRFDITKFHTIEFKLKDIENLKY